LLASLAIGCLDSNGAISPTLPIGFGQASGEISPIATDDGGVPAETRWDGLTRHDADQAMFVSMTDNEEAEFLERAGQNFYTATERSRTRLDVRAPQLLHADS
jgi:hypothetical protein